jgi:lipopolysaccharide biosynthesis glycosyltransferase
MRILLTFDTGYAPHAAAVMESIIQNCPEKLDFVVIYYDLKQETQDILLKHFEEKVKSFEFVKLDETVLESTVKGVKTAEHLKGFNTYLRLFSPTLLPNDEYIIYLDCDIIVLDNILKITDGVDLSKPVCAVTEYDPAYKYKDIKNLRAVGAITRNTWIIEAYNYRAYNDLGMDQNAKYFNAGVLIINLEEWRENNIAEKAISFLLEHPEKAYAADQDALNHAINGDYFTLDLRWNFIGDATLYSNYKLDAIKNALKNPAIIHVIGPNKPWKYMCDFKFQKKYRHYRKCTPWPEIKYQDKTLRKIIKKYILLGGKKILKLLLGKHKAAIFSALVFPPIVPHSTIRIRE